jgi:hypothetical protein
MTATYDKLGLSFLYPENWRLIDEIDATPHVVTLESPEGSSTWTVHAYPLDVSRDEILKETIATLEQTYEDLEITPIEESIGEFEGQGIEAMFYCLDFLVQAKLLFVEAGDQLLMIWMQAEDREFDQQAIVFQAIAISMLREM